MPPSRTLNPWPAVLALTSGPLIWVVGSIVAEQMEPGSDGLGLLVGMISIAWTAVTIFAVVVWAITRSNYRNR